MRQRRRAVEHYASVWTSKFRCEREGRPGRTSHTHLPRRLPFRSGAAAAPAPARACVAGYRAAAAGPAGQSHACALPACLLLTAMSSSSSINKGPPVPADHHQLAIACAAERATTTYHAIDQATRPGGLP